MLKINIEEKIGSIGNRIISRFLERLIKKKTGFNPGIKISSFSMEDNTENEIVLDVTARIVISKNDISSWIGDA